MLRRLPALLGLAALLAAAPAAPAQQTSNYAQFFVTDVTGANVLSDARNGGKYRDYRLTDGDPCVNATASTSTKTSGDAMLSPPRVFDGTCTAPGPRHVRYYLPPGIAGALSHCSQLDAVTGQTYVQDVKRLWFIGLFSSAALTGGAAARFGFYCGGGGYSIQPVQKVPVTKLSDTARQVHSNGVMSRLYYVSGGEYYPVIDTTTGNPYPDFHFVFNVTAESVPSTTKKR
jgi:hypothetical protein